jgi:hypothetical protein
MAQPDTVATPVEADMAALFWWRREAVPRAESEAPALLNARLVALGERVAALPHRVDLPGNRLRASAAARPQRATLAPKAAIALDRDIVTALRSERRSARVALAIALIATAAPLAAAIYAAIVQQPLALAFAIAGGVAASVALYHAARWFLLTRAEAVPNILA